MKKGSKAGFVLQMICGIGMLAIVAFLFVGDISSGHFSWLLMLFLAAAFLFIVFAVLGKKRVWPNVINLIVTAPFLLNLCIQLINLLFTL